MRIEKDVTKDARYLECSGPVGAMALARLEKDEMSSAQPSELKSMDGLERVRG
jgi:hypothetical protein